MTEHSTSRLGRYAPGLHTLVHYRRSWVRGDLLAGLAVAAYLIPQVMAYAELAGLPAIHGLWAAVGPLAVYALLGSSRPLSVGPESTTALMTAAALGAVTVGHDSSRYAATAAVLALATGVICLLARLARLGYLADLLSKPVLTGYLLGIAVLMIVSQLGKITGLSVTGDSVVGEVWFVVRHLGEVQLPTLVLSAAVLALLIVLHRIIPHAPVTLIVMVLAAAAVAAIGPTHLGLAVVGPLPEGLPRPAVPDLSGVDLTSLLPAALGIAVVGFSDNVLTARAFAGRRDEKVDSSQELLALGAVNLASGLFQGFPVSSSGSRTAIAHATGARSQLTSLVAVGAVLTTLMVLGSVLATFPLAALGGVVMFAAGQLVDLPGLWRLGRIRRSELILAVLTTAAVLVAGVLVGIAIAVGLSILDLLRRIARPHDGVLGFIPGVAGMHDVADYPQGHQVPGLLIYRYDSPLFFANAADFGDRALKAVDQAEQPVRWFVLNAEANVEIDSTAADALDDLRGDLQRRGIVFAVARAKHEIYESLDAVGLVDSIGTDHFFMTLPSAVEAYQRAYPPSIDSVVASDRLDPTPGPE